MLFLSTRTRFVKKWREIFLLVQLYFSPIPFFKNIIIKFKPTLLTAIFDMATPILTPLPTCPSTTLHTYTIYPTYVYIPTTTIITRIFLTTAGTGSQLYGRTFIPFRQPPSTVHCFFPHILGCFSVKRLMQVGDKGVPKRKGGKIPPFFSFKIPF